MKKNKNTNKEKKKFIYKIKDRVIEFKNHPIDSLKKLYDRVVILVKNNKSFFAYVFINLINAIMLRFLTIGGINSIFRIPPLLCDLCFIMVLGSFGFLMSDKKRNVYYVIVSLIMTALCTINSSYYTFYTSFASVSFLSTTKFLVSVGDAVVENVLQLKDFLYPIMFVGLIILLINFYKNSNKIGKSVKKFKSTLKASVVILAIFCCTLTGTDISNLVKQWNRVSIVNKYGIYTYHLNDLFKSIEPKLTSLFGYDSALKKFNEYFIEFPEENKTNEYTNIFEGKNVIGIHAESIQNFVIGLKFNGQEVTPNLNKLASKSLYFTNFYSQVSVGTSSDTEFTLATSLMPSNTGTAFGSYFDRKYIALPQLLKDKGYYTFAMHGNTADYWNRRVMHKNLGYDYFYAKSEFNIDETIGLGLSDKSFFRQAIEKLKVIDSEHENYYGTFIMLTNHTPFSEVQKYGNFDVSLTVNGVKYPYLEGTKLGNYLKSVHYADEALGQFLNDLESNGLMDNTVIVLYGDHDARLPEDDYIKMYNYDYKNDDLLDDNDKNYKKFDDYDYELNRKVPLIIYSKDVQARKINTVMGMYDLMPTLGNMLNVKNEYALGHDIFNHLDDNLVVFPTGNWLTNKVYYNSQKSEHMVLNKNTVISDEYIKKYSNRAEKILGVSNAIIVYDLIGKQEEDVVNESKFTGDN